MPKRSLPSSSSSSPFLLPVLGLLASCGGGARKERAPVASPAAVIGANDMRLVVPPFEGLPPALRTAALSIGRLSSPCTVTHLGEGLAVTAAHCLPSRDAPDCSSLTVLWDDPSMPRAEIPCARVERFEFEAGVDVALLRFSVFPSSKVPVAAAGPVGGAALAVLSHPGGGPLMDSGRCARLASPRLMLSTQFAHDCDTTSGSSGAAVLDAATGALVGIHSAGVSGSGERYNVATLGGSLRLGR